VEDLGSESINNNEIHDINDGSLLNTFILYKPDVSLVYFGIVNLNEKENNLCSQ
jgi:hypothetical protein